MLFSFLFNLPSDLHKEEFSISTSRIEKQRKEDEKFSDVTPLN
jgi:hypothetical protein